MARRSILLLVDEAMVLLEQVEKALGDLAVESRDGSVSPGTVYRAYTGLVRLHEKLAEIREAAYRAGMV